MQFMKNLKPRTKLMKYKLYSIERTTGIIVYAKKYKDSQEILVLTKENFEAEQVKTWGWHDFFRVEEDCNMWIAGTAYFIPKGTTFIENRLQVELEEPEIAIFIPENVSLSYDDWRLLRAEIDEVFYLCGKEPD